MSNNLPIDNCAIITRVGDLTKREQFAMAAMQGILASEYYGDFCNDGNKHTGNTRQSGAAASAVAHADALLAELERTK